VFIIKFGNQIKYIFLITNRFLINFIGGHQVTYVRIIQIIVTLITDNIINNILHYLVNIRLDIYEFFSYLILVMVSLIDNLQISYIRKIFP